MKGFSLNIITVFFFLTSVFVSHQLIAGNRHHYEVLNDKTDSVKKNSIPSKELMISALRELYSLLEAKNYESAVSLFIEIEGVSQEELQTDLSSFIEKKEISASGIDILENKAVFGKVVDLYGEKGKREIEKKNLNSKKCYGLFIPGTIIEVMALWDKTSFKFFRMDNVGKLEN